MKQFLLLLFLFSNIFLFGQLGYPVQISTNTDDYESARKAISTDFDGDGDLDILHSVVFSGHVFLSENIDEIDEFKDPFIIASPIFNPFVNSIDDFDAADFDLDGDDDVIVIDGSAIKIYTNNRQNTLLPLALEFEVPVTVNELRVIDFDTDGFPDILIEGGGGIGWYKNNGGTDNFADFQLLTDFSAASRLQMIDFDNDGDYDIIALNPSDNTIILLTNTDNSSFNPPLLLANGQNSIRNIVVVDDDGDNDLDIFTETYNAGNIYRFENLGEGNDFAEGTAVTSDESVFYSKPYFADYDDDGDIDFLVMGNYDLVFFENLDGLGNFSQTASLFLLAGTLSSIVESDFNNDNILDLLVLADDAVVDRGQLLIFQGKGGLNYYNPVDIGSDTDDIVYLTSADLNGDEKVELITGANYFDKGTWAQFDGAPDKLRKPHLFPIRGSLNAIQIADLDGDMNNDILVISEPSSSNGSNIDMRLSWIRKLDVEPDYDTAIPLFELTSGTIRSAETGDFDNDGDQDILFSSEGNTSDDGLHIILNDGEGNFTEPIKVSEVGDVYSGAYSVDYDSDGDLDFIAKKLGLDVMLFLNTGNGTFNPEEILFPLGVSNNTKLLLKDLNNDGIKDIFLASNGSGELSWIEINGSGSIGEAIPISMGNFSNIGETALADIDSDGDLDVYIKVYSNDFNFYWYQNINNGEFSPAEPLLEEYSVNSDLHFFDFDNDADTDMIFTVPSEEAMYYQENYLNYTSIEGIVFYDTNENGIADQGEPPLNLQNVVLEPTALASFSTGTGSYYFAAGKGGYQITCYPNENFTLTTPQTVDIFVEANNSDIQTVNFGVAASNSLLEGTLTLTSGPTRCGFEVPFWLDYQNTGTIVSDGITSLPLDPLVSFVSSQPVPDSIVGNTVYWSFDDLFPTQSDQIEMVLQMPSVDFLGEEIGMIATMDLVSDNGSQTAEAEDVFNSIINCSYDPNDKQVKPNYPGYENFTEFGDTLDYTVRFQNTGTDTAFTIRIEDFLDPNLDWNTLRIIGASHDYTASLNYESGRLLFTFADILLPDSTTNEILSHGYVRYTMEHKEGLNDGTYIKNTANILFDFNPPIITNTVYSLLTSNFPLVFDLKNPACHGENTGSITAIFDNPFYTNYVWDGDYSGDSYTDLAAGEYNLIITTIQGNQLDTTFLLTESDSLYFDEYEITDIDCNTEGSIDIEIQGGTPPYNFAWNNGIFENSLNNIYSEGTYGLVVTDIARCSITESFEITASDDVLVFTTSSQSANTNSLNGSASINVTSGIPPYTYDWSHSNSIDEPTAEGLAAGDYSVTVTDGNGCQIIAEIVVDQLSSLFYSSEGEYFIVYPNPSSGDINIKFLHKNVTNFDLTVTDILGRSVYQTLGLDENDEEIKISLPPGQYFVSLFNDEFSTRRLVLVNQ